MPPENPVTLEERQQSGKPVVLCVDDDPVHHKLMHLLARHLGFTVMSVSSCAQAIESLKTFSFDLVLLDYKMPDVDGIKCTMRIRAQKELRGKLPILAVTANIVPGAREECLAAGMDDFLAKPFTMEELQEKLAYWVHQRTE